MDQDPEFIKLYLFYLEETGVDLKQNNEDNPSLLEQNIHAEAISPIWNGSN